MKDCTRWLLRTIAFWSIVLLIDAVSVGYVIAKLGLEYGLTATIAAVVVACAIVAAVAGCFGHDPRRRRS